MDRISAPRRSANMRSIRSKDTKPELRVRALLRKLGMTGYRLHRKDLPGRPDIAFIGRKKAIFVHGCFWHGHDCPEGRRRPASRQGYWLPKIAGNQARDARHAEALQAAGWDILLVWECDARSEDLGERLETFVLGVAHSVEAHAKL